MENEVYSCLHTVMLLLSAGFNVNAKNNKGNTPLHIAANFKPRRSDKICLLAEILQVLTYGGILIMILSTIMVKHPCTWLKLMKLA